MSESERLTALRSYDILDTVPEKDFEDIVELASIICDTPISLVSLVDSDRQWFKASKGLDAKETPREYAFCHHTIQNPSEVMVVSDSTLDDRFKSNPLVTGDPNIRFYAGAPLIDNEGHPLGTLCIIDKKPRDFCKREEKALKALAKRVMDLLELRKENISQKKQLLEKESELKLMLDRFLKAQQTARIGSWDWDVLADKLYWSPEMYEIFGLEETDSENLLEKWQSKVHPKDLYLVRDTLTAGLKENKSNSIEYRILGKNDKEIWVETTGAVEVDRSNQALRMHGTVQNITARKNAEADRFRYSETLETIMNDFSHKVRQPLTNCMGIIQVIDFDNISLEKAQEFANYLKISASKFDGLVREMSDFVYQNKEKLS